MNPYPYPAAGPAQGLVRTVGRYAIYGEIATGGMATVHLGRMMGQAGFSKTVAIKRPHPQFAKNPEFVRMIVDEARLAARIQHPNVVATLDVVSAEDELLLVLEYVHGESLWHLLGASFSSRTRMPFPVIGKIAFDALNGLHAAHEATDETGMPLGIVHRDVSPQNIMVGVDGVTRVLDFGVAKATGRLQSTVEGQLKGKLPYMTPEQVTGAPVDRTTDVYAMAAVLWGAIVGRRLVEGQNEAEVLNNVLRGNFPPPSACVAGVTPAIDEVLMRALRPRPEQRFQTARDMALAVEEAFGTATPFEVAEWVKSFAADALALRTARIREMESSSEVRVSTHDPAGAMMQRSGTYDVRFDQGGVATVGSPAGAPPGFPFGSAHGSISRTVAIGSAPPPTGSGPLPVLPETVVGMIAPRAAPAPWPDGNAPAQDEPRRSAASLVAVGLLVFVLTLGAVLVGIWKLGPASWRPGQAAPQAEAEPPATPSSAAPPAGVSASPTAPPIAEAAPTATTPPAETAAPKASTSPDSSGHPSTTPSSKGQSSGEGKRKKKAVDCDASPFYVDRDGIKQVRPECM